jgi:hypothetical protein
MTRACTVGCAGGLLMAASAGAVEPPPSTPESIATKRLSCDEGQIGVNSAAPQAASERSG